MIQFPRRRIQASGHGIERQPALIRIERNKSPMAAEADSNKPGSRNRIYVWLVLIIIGALLTYLLFSANYFFAKTSPGGNDFLVHWIGAKTLLRGGDPYSDQTALEIQNLIFGRAALPGEIEHRVAYPLFAEFLFIPFALVNSYVAARALFMTAMELATIGLAAAGWFLSGKPGIRWQIVVFLVFSILWYFSARALINGNPIILASLFFGLAWLCAQRRNDILAGVFLALSTFKPQVMILPAICLLLWWMLAGRKRAWISFGISLAGLVGVSTLVLPSWIWENWREILRYPAYNPPGNPAAVFSAVFGTGGVLPGWLLSLSVCLLILGSWIGLRTKDQNKIRGIIFLTILLSPLSGLMTDPGNEYLLLLPLAYALAGPAGTDRPKTVRFIFVLAVTGIGLWWLFLATVKMGPQPMQHPLLLFPLPVFLLLITAWDYFRARRSSAPVTRA
jgi:hypothetical protein